MLASAANRLPTRPPGSWVYEFKWDGVRAIATIRGSDSTLHSRLGGDVTPRYPELHGGAQLLRGRSAVVDGEVVAVDSEGRPSFARLQSRMHVTDAARIRRLVRTTPCVYLLFDLLALDGESLLGLPYEERRRRLAELDLNTGTWHTPAARRDAAGTLAAARRLGLEGVVAKRLDSVYEPGRRSPAWVKVRLMRRQEFVIAGWTPGRGDRLGQIGALLVGYYDGDRLRYAGKVGTGFDRAENDRLRRLFESHARSRTPFADPVPWREARYLNPDLVAEVRFADWTGDGKLRHPSYQGQRPDKDPRDVVRET